MKRLVPIALLLALTTSHPAWADEEKKTDAQERAEKENKTSVNEEPYAEAGTDDIFDEGTSDVDKRIRTFVYTPDKIYVLRARYGYQSNIEFSPTEEIQTISVGDRSLWQIVPAGHRLFVRPMDENMTTNMTIITNRRSYQFDLKAGAADDKSRNIIYVARFLYPSHNRAAPAPYGFAATPAYAPPVYPAPVAPVASGFAPPSPPPGAMPPPPPLPEAVPPSGMAKAAAPAPSFTAPMPQPMTTAPAKSSGLPAGDPNLNGATPSGEIAAETLPTPLSPRPDSASAMAAKIDEAKAPTSLTPSTGTAIGAPAATAEALPPVAPPDALQPNFDYTYSGSDTVAPIQVYDDGANTYIKYRDMTSKSLPDVYVVTASGQEKLVPSRRQGEHVVIEQVAREMVVRSAYGKATIYNEAAGTKVP